MKIVLAGSPNISVAAFEEVIKNFNVVAIVTQPDRKKGRGMKKESTPVAKLGKKYNIPVFKPEKISLISHNLEKLHYDLFFTFAFGQYIPSFILKQGVFKPLNIHGSLLPKYRGAAPIHAAILNGDSEIGITLMEMVKEMDAGDMFFKASKVIDEETTVGEAFEIIAELAKNNIVKWLKSYFNKQVIGQKQGDHFTVFGKIKKDFAELTSNINKYQAIRKVKALNPIPGAFIMIDQKRLKVFNMTDKAITGAIKLNFSDGSLFATDYQWANKKRVKIDNSL